ncbi:tRNA(fMet)-specific endonuclease VapC [Arcticibacter tournemirensis]|uniref:Ribonuclease VapC n=1 Tax=Arcticibacter tournemirensis TaxID=699437 RepID=A0A5M9H3Q8_9SPHI|nr:type II toxin-antitoxin system VapC family toxin [Arcticibacter tournemirensis]KAA8481542.1 type II toxin-antitoxin system VapC family toxin [Arcticibacter tournemirensis]TQM49072.1 tRNA(fMet)-specific endonuclease VapC [Arcticibacter tournemirensis]
MKKYLLDTNICIYFLKGLYDIHSRIEKEGIGNCYISEITVAELKYGAENSKTERKTENRRVVAEFIQMFTILPIFNSLDIYASEKARLRKSGLPVDDFDLLIGATSIANRMVMVTNNYNHFERIKDIKLEDWTK